MIISTKQIRYRKNKHVAALFIITICTLMILQGCIPDTPELDFRDGTEGLVLSLEGPDEIKLVGSMQDATEEYSFTVENKGTYTVEDDQVYLKIRVADEFLKDLTSSTSTVSLQKLSSFNGGGKITQLYGKTRYYKEGDSVQHFTSFKTSVPLGTSITSTIDADLCYLYRTTLSKTICITTKKRYDNKGCSEKVYSFSNGQGAPVAITQAEVRESTAADSTVNEIRIMLTIENVGGDLVGLGTKDGASVLSDLCTSQSYLNQLEITSAKLGNRDLTCNLGNSIISLEEDEKVVECKLTTIPSTDNTLEGYMQTPLNINLTYAYHANSQKEVDIVSEEFD